MKKEYIKYQNLSIDIKSEIERYHSEILKTDKQKSIEDSMLQWFEKEFDNWILNRMGKGKKDSRRKHFRINLVLPVKILDMLVESSVDDDSARYLVGKVVNISRGGLYFKYFRPIEVSSIIKVNIDLSEIDPELSNIEALAMVLRVDKFGPEDYGIGIMFSSIYDSNRENLDLFILKNLTSYINSGSV